MSKMSIRFYNDRAIWDEETGKWWFSAVDVVSAINNEDDSTKSRKYWNIFKTRHEEFQSSTICRQLKMTANDGKMYLTDCIEQANQVESQWNDLISDIYRIKGIISVLYPTTTIP